MECNGTCIYVSYSSAAKPTWLPLDKNAATKPKSLLIQTRRS